MTAKGVLKKAYLILPFKKNVFSILKKFIHIPPKIYQHLYFIGVFKVQVDQEKSFKIKHIGAKVENEIFWNGLYGSWEKESLKIWSFLCNRSKYIFDIGANTGMYAIVAKTINHNSQVYAFEPVERVFERLKENINLNGFDIIPYNIGLSNFDGKAIIHDPGTDHVYSVTINKNLLPNHVFSNEIRIDVSRFNSWFRKHEVEGLDLIKIDVETHEPEVVEGMLELIRKFRPTIIIEVLDKIVAEKLNRLLGEVDYMYYSIDELNGLQKIERISKSPGYNLLLCTKDIESLLLKEGILKSGN